MMNRSTACHLIFSALLIFPSLVQGQDGLGSINLRNIRIQKLAKDWQGQRLSFRLDGGNTISGHLTAVDFYEFRLQTSQGMVTLPIEDVQAVILSPGPTEALLVMLSGAMGAAFTWGVVSLSGGSLAPAAVNLAASAGGLIGGAIGYRTFFREVTHELH